MAQGRIRMTPPYDSDRWLKTMYLGVLMVLALVGIAVVGKLVFG